MCGFSFQPMKGGPWYIFHNVNAGTYLHALKVKRITGPSVIYGNTFVSKTSRLGQGADVLRGTLANNVWLRMSPGPIAERGRFNPQFSPTHIDHNAWGTGGAEPFSGIGYSELAKKHGWDQHSKFVNAEEIFEERIAAPAGSPYYSSDLQGKAIPKDWWFEHSLFLPRDDSPLIDAGMVLANITGPYLGAAPDLGAHEQGLGTAWHGPRTWDDASGLVYGEPDGWSPRPVAEASKYSALGCPAPTGERAVLLARTKPDAFVLIEFVAREGGSRWTELESLVASGDGALTPRLEFQESLVARLYERSDHAQLVAGRLEPTGFLRVTGGCRSADLPAARADLFRIVRSLGQ
jgi:hypothetical protein